MKLSIFITSYKFKPYIKECVDSVLAQKTNFPTEIIVRDDGTNDGTYEMLIELYEKIPGVKVLDSRNNVGAVKNMLTCLSNCSGQYVAHVDGDDLLIDTGYYQRAVEYLDAHENYSLYCSGYKYIEDGIIHPEKSWLCSGVLDMELKDLLVENYVSSARVFRNMQINESAIDDVIYPDWAFNFEILKRGRAICDASKCAYLYRIHDGGMFSKKSKEEKRVNNAKMIDILTERYYKINHKTISIVDSFVHNDRVREKLSNTLNWLMEDGHEVLLITNTSVDKDILKKTTFCIYDSRNQLFQQQYTNISWVDFWKTVGGIDMLAHDVVSGIQKHGLSVLINLFNALIFARDQGYTHFQRFEVDDIYGENSRKFIKTLPGILHKENKNGMFYYNRQNSPPDVSFHFFYFHIETFLSKIKRILCEDDYVSYLMEFYNNKDFKNAETFLYDYLKKSGDNDVLKRDYTQMIEDFSDTHWNTETSISNYESKYASNCTSKIYTVRDVFKETGEVVFKPEYILLTYLFVDSTVHRKILVESQSGKTFEINHTVSCAGGWAWHMLPPDTKCIHVYENEKYLYTETAKDSVCYIEFKK